jgi:predicted transposase YbfD/YdcC
VLSVRRHALQVSTGKETNGERFFIASQTREQTSPRQFAGQVRDHWAVENKNHWKRDALWREDRTRLRNAKAVCTLALLRGALIPLLNEPLPDRFSRTNDDISSALKMLRQPLTDSQ